MKVLATIRKKMKELAKKKDQCGGDTFVRKSRLANIYHCCTHKSGSQWLRQIFNDPIVFQHCGLRQYAYADYLPDKMDDRKVKDRCFHHRFPNGAIVSPLYITYDNFTKIPKNLPYKTLFIQRDPRDLITSYYFSMKFSHSDFAPVKARRQKLQELDTTEGLIFCMDHLMHTGTFDVLKSWNKADDETVLVLRYEDLIDTRSHHFFKLLFDHCEINVTEHSLHDLLKRYEFKTLSDGRVQGQENIYHHYRKGIAGDWKNYFTEETVKTFKAKTKRLIIDLSYEKDENW